MDLGVADLAAAQPFYDALLPALGFTERHHGETWKVWATIDRFRERPTARGLERLDQIRGVLGSRPPAQALARSGTPGVELLVR